MRTRLLTLAVAALALVLPAQALADDPPPVPGGGAGLHAQLAISAPTDGATVTAGAVVVSGTATPVRAFRSLTVNGIGVTPAADGTFSATVTLGAGSAGVDIVGRDLFDRPVLAHVSLTVTAPAAAPQPAAPAAVTAAAPAAPKAVACVVPSLRRLTLAQARGRLVAAHCALGRIVRARSRLVVKGRVSAQLVRAGTRLAGNAPVGLVLSRGR